jgi:hypothetical protein
MVSGDTQAIDSALVSANASLEKLQAKCLVEWVVEKNVDLPADPTSKPLVEFTLVPNPKKIARNNRTHHSPTDGEARLAQKPNKLCGGAAAAYITSQV